MRYRIFCLSAALLTGAIPALRGGEARVFASPESAVAALAEAAASTNRLAFQDLFGDEARELVNPDEVQGDAELSEFSAAFNTAHRLIAKTDTRLALEVGPDAWPFPIPLARVENGWRFDTRAGIEELLNRRIGRNELDVLQVLRAYVEAQREYAVRDRDGDDVLEYAQRIRSSPGRMDGLYWSPGLTGEVSPLGPAFARAQAEGYGMSERQESSLRPFHGYLYRIVTRQGRHAPGAAYDYVINGNMIGGFAIVAWPAAYGESGIMTFMVNQRGRVYQRDLGAETGRRARKLKDYDPAPGWLLSPD